MDDWIYHITIAAIMLGAAAGFVVTLAAALGWL